MPLGIWIAACLIGWHREDGVIRCDDYLTDYLAVRASPVAVLVPTTDELEHCRPGESLRFGPVVVEIVVASERRIEECVLRPSKKR